MGCPPRVQRLTRKGRAEVLLSTPTPRWRWIGSHTVVAWLGSALVVVGGGFGLGATAALAQDDLGTLVRTVGASAVYLPAVWLIIGVSLVLIGFAPRRASLAWGLWTLWIVLAMFGTLLEPPGWVLDLSPFEHTPFVPAQEVAPGPLVAILGVTGGLVGIGLLGARHRDVG